MAGLSGYCPKIKEIADTAYETYFPKLQSLLTDIKNNFIFRRYQNYILGSR